MIKVTLDNRLLSDGGIVRPRDRRCREQQRREGNQNDRM